MRTASRILTILFVALALLLAVGSVAQADIRMSVEIDASPEDIWKALTDFESYPAWNPFICRIAGELREGARLDVLIQPLDARAMSFRPTLRLVEPNRELRWIGHLGLPGLFDGEHSFSLVPLGPNRTRLIQREFFTGALVPLLAFGLARKTRRGFDQMNRALKARVESGG